MELLKGGNPRTGQSVRAPPFRCAPWGAAADFCRLSFHTFHPAKICYCGPAKQDKETVSSYYKGCSPCSFLTVKFISAGRAILIHALQILGESHRLSVAWIIFPTCLARPHQGSSAQPLKYNARLPQPCQNTLRLGFDKPVRRARNPAALERCNG
jgi:hypothetical protein